VKKLIILILPLFIAISGCSINNEKNDSSDNIISSTNDNLYVKSVWITYYELQELIADTEKEFKNNIKNAFENLIDMGFNTVTIQVRPCADAFYKSDYFPSSKYCFGKQGSDMPYDPLQIMCDVAQSVKINIEAWINPYRVSQDNKIDELCDDNIAKLWYNNKKTKSYVYIDESAIYFNPGVDEVNDLIINGVKEIVQNYNITAIHFDDYFYPTTQKSIDKTQYSEYKEQGGKLSLSNWRRENISNMIKSVYKAIKNVNSDVLFGISPASDIDNDYSKLYADVETWVSNDGYVDYICPQIYFGFKNVYQPFMFTTKKWVSMSKCDLYVGLPLYKCGKVDEYAAENETQRINEFVDNNDIISRQINYLSKIDEVKGFYIFSYSYLFKDDCKEEVENMLSVMQNSNLD
jgi:uncharacterized lipoprotein YddW (UPF0748 family)